MCHCLTTFLPTPKTRDFYFVLMPAVLFRCSVLLPYLSDSTWPQTFSHHRRNPLVLRGNRSVLCNLSHVKHMVISDDDATISVGTGFQANDMKGQAWSPKEKLQCTDSSQLQPWFSRRTNESHEKICPTTCITVVTQHKCEKREICPWPRGSFWRCRNR